MPVDLLVLGAALLTGLLGGVHCIAMCGGIATGLAATSPKPGLGTAFARNGGRVGGYTIAGALVGAVAHPEAFRLGMPALILGNRPEFGYVKSKFDGLVENLGTKKPRALEPVNG